MPDQDMTTALCEQVKRAYAAQTPLSIQGGGSKTFYGRHSAGEPLTVSGHTGILSYEPSELVLRARAGTRLAEIEQILADKRQMLAFEPPHFADGGTLGGAVAAGLSGPRRPFAGAVRDFVLGTGLINGKGEHLNFGGQVMKNVAGYDLSRLMAGALGTLGVLTDVALKVLPTPDVEYTLAQVCSQAEAIARLAEWLNKPLPISAACWYDDHLYLRLSGSESATRQAQHRLGDNRLEQRAEFWQSLRDHRHPFFDGDGPLWRLSVPPATPPLALPGKWLVDWAGAQRWLISDADAIQVRKLAADLGGHATMFRRADAHGEVFQPLPAGLLALHKRLKAALDPAGILNPGRLYRDL
jgi:glycolate oxidase FAD binding subunit